MKDLSDFREYFVEKYYDEAWLTDARVRYETANPFPHIVIDDFLPPETLDEVLANFSQYNKDNWYKFDGQYEHPTSRLARCYASHHHKGEYQQRVQEHS